MIAWTSSHVHFCLRYGTRSWTVIRLVESCGPRPRSTIWTDRSGVPPPAGGALFVPACWSVCATSFMLFSPYRTRALYLRRQALGHFDLGPVIDRPRNLVRHRLDQARGARVAVAALFH